MSAPTLHRFAVLPSTQDALHYLAQQGAPAGTAVVAAEQTQGRGSRGREWSSPIGGLWMSVLLRPEQELAMEVLSLRVAMAVAVAIEARLAGIRLQLKWPNDLLLGSRKVGGILCEARWHGASLGWVAVGLGLNVTNPIPEAVAHSAIGLDTVAQGLTPEELARPLSQAIAAVGLERGLLGSDELADFHARDGLAGKRITAPADGVVQGIAPDGSLLVCQASGATLALRTGAIVLAR